MFDSIDARLDIAAFGAKAHWLSWLRRHGFNVPHAVALQVLENRERIVDFKRESLEEFKAILKPFRCERAYDVAVRSSATCEDAAGKSYAGHFKTVLGKYAFRELAEAIEEVASSLDQSSRADGCRMGVLVQQRVHAGFSGVVFSSNPITKSKSELVLSVVQGMGSALVSGQEAGEDIVLRIQDRTPRAIQVPDCETAIPEDTVANLALQVKAIEAKLGFPVDVEWCTEEESGELFLLQCRPATGMLHQQPELFAISRETEDRIPADAVRSRKVTLRLRSEQVRVPMSIGYIATVNCRGTSNDIPDVSAIRIGSECVAYSVVVISPSTVEGKVVRYFVGCGASSREFIEDQLKNGEIISSPDHCSLQKCLESVRDVCHRDSWAAVAIIQEIYDPVFSGVMRRIGNDYILELARGHFVPKGAVAVSQFVVSSGGSLKLCNEARQQRALRIIDGFVVAEDVAPENQSVTLPASTLMETARVLAPFVDDQATSVEFGLVLDPESTDLSPYVIDCAVETDEIDLGVEEIASGIISKGRVVGELVAVEDTSKIGNSLDMHYHDKSSEELISDRAVVYLCERPDIALTALLGLHRTSQVGFVFKQGSTLCHLAIILREKQIPAVVAAELDDIVAGETVELDALSVGLAGKERIRPLNDC